MEIDKEKLKEILNRISEIVPYTNDYHLEDYTELSDMIKKL